MQTCPALNLPSCGSNHFVLNHSGCIVTAALALVSMKDVAAMLLEKAEAHSESTTALLQVLSNRPTAALSQLAFVGLQLLS